MSQLHKCGKGTGEEREHWALVGAHQHERVQIKNARAEEGPVGSRHLKREQEIVSKEMCLEA